jgi:hypothetical protein
MLWVRCGAIVPRPANASPLMMTCTSGKASAVGVLSNPAADEFEALACRVAVFRFEAVGRN